MDKEVNPMADVVMAINGIADELYELRKENREINGHLQNMASALDFVGQHTYDISWQLKKNGEERVVITKKDVDSFQKIS
jgi:hypothetical protein